MDLRRYALAGDVLAAARALLNYQPFRVAETVVTGVGHSWRYGDTTDALYRPQLVFDRDREAPEIWERAVAENHRLARSYETFLDAIAAACPGGSYLDLCCNTGYFPVGASLRGMAPAIGVDVLKFDLQIDLLNHVTGAKAVFQYGEYEPSEHRFRLPSGLPARFDVVSNLAFMCHVPDPLSLLKVLAELADHAVFLWAPILASDELLIRYHGERRFFGKPFPWGFDDGTAISEALLLQSMDELGFPRHAEIAPPSDGWPVEWDNPMMKPYQPMRAFLFTRA